MRPRILVLARDVGLRARLARLLQGGGYRVELAESAAQARRIDLRGVDLALVVPEGLGAKGEGLLDELATAAGRPLLVAAPGSPVPPGAGVLDASDEAGVLARVARALQPAADADAPMPVLQFAGFSLDLAGRSLVDQAGQEIPLTRSEFGLLHAFVQRPGRVLSRDTLLQALAGRDADAYDRSIDMLVVRLRRKIEPDPKHPSLILTIPGSGYKFAAKVRIVAASVPPEPEAAAPAEPAPSASERRYVTALSAELIPAEGGSLASDPEETRAIIDGYRHYANAVIARYGGTAAQWLGREMRAYFGYPVAQEDAAERALHAGLTLAEHLAEGEAALPSGLAIRVGIASGLVVTDPAGEVLGETPSEAARLHHLAEPGQVIISANTRRLAGGLFGYRELGPLAVRGATSPVQAWQVLGPSALGSRTEALYVDARMPLVDREDELTLLRRAWQQAISGEGRLVLLSGEPGIGKSRLLAAVEAELEGEPHVSLRYFCSPLHQDSALHPIIMRWEQEAGFARDDSAEQRLRKLEAILAPADLPSEDAALIAALLSVPTGEGYPRLDLSPQQRKERTFAALLRWLARLTGQQPVLMLFEDAQWADPSSLELLDRLIDQLAERSILLVISFRPEFVAPWIGHAGANLVALSRLTRQQSATLAAQVTAERVITPAVLERIVAQTDGVPLFIEELTKAVLETALDSGEAAPTLTVPGTLRASLMARLDRLPTAKQVAQIGAVIGREFPYALLAAVAGLPEARLAQGLDELATSGLASRRGVPPDAVYTFKHALIQDAAYESLLKSRRQQLHGKIAVVLEERWPETKEVQPELLAHHYAAASLAERSIGYWRRAAERAIGRFANLEAIVHCDEAVAQLHTLPSSAERLRVELEVQLAKGVAVRAGRGYSVPESEQVFLRACELCKELNDRVRLVHALRGLFGFYYVAARWSDAAQVADRIGAAATGLDDRVVQCIRWTMDGAARLFRGEPAEAIARLQEALRSYHEDDSETHLRLTGHEMASLIRFHLAIAEWLVGLPETAARTAEESMAIARRVVQPFPLAQALGNSALLHTLSREWDAAEALASEVFDVSVRHGIPDYVSFGSMLAGTVIAAKGDATRGASLACRSMAELRRAGWQCFVPILLVYLAAALGASGEADAALEAVSEALRLIRTSGEFAWESEALRVKGEVKLATGRADAFEAEVDLRAALEVAEQQGAKAFQLRAAISLARLWARQGKRREGRNLLTPIYRRFTEGFSTQDLREAGELLDDSPLTSR
jgi:DNA-binding response OmpR family regulator/class 3 adenylate cyclase/predicted ATPase